MTLLSWLIVIIPLVCVLGLAFYSKRYVRDVADYLACGRVAGRYVIAVGDITSGLSVIVLVAMVEKIYRVGIAIEFWEALYVPLGIFLSLTGFCLYRFRQTRALSLGQFLEQRYSRSFRITAAAIRTITEMMANAIGPAVAVRFFIYFIGLPHKIPVFGMELPTYGLLVAFLLILAYAILYPGGRVSLVITDAIQGIMSFPIFVIFTVWILTEISWFSDVGPVMLDRAQGQSFLNPTDIEDLRDFNLFALFVFLFTSILNRASWFGNDCSNAGRTPHEQKMASILGAWRNGFSWMMCVLIAIFIIVFMLHGRYADQANDVRIDLSTKVAKEVIDDPDMLAAVVENISVLKPIPHEIGVDEPYSQDKNPDSQYYDTTLQTIQQYTNDEGEGNAIFQEFQAIYRQMMMPIAFGNLFPPVLMGLFSLLMVMLLLSTDDSRIFNASATLIQDVIMPFRKNPMSTKEHLIYLRVCSLATVIFFFVVSLFFAQLDFINMFISLMTGVWLGGAGPIMVGGLYTRFGTTFGAWCALISGSGSALAGLLIQRNWPGTIYPFLDNLGMIEPLGNFLHIISKPFNPYIVWEMNPINFPINGIELSFISMLFGLAAYFIGSWLTCKKPFNLDRMLHRGKYADQDSIVPTEKLWSWNKLYETLIGITNEYSFGDKVITWVVFLWSVGWGFGVMFVGVLIWNALDPFTSEGWSMYFYINLVLAALIVGSVSTVWYFIGGVFDIRALFRDLNKRVANPLDDGRVEGGISLADKERFDAIDRESESEQ